MPKTNQKLPPQELSAITPLDGRYREKVIELAPFVSESSLIKLRIEIEIKYILKLIETGILKNVKKTQKHFLNHMVNNITEKNLEEIKIIEEKTRHDVKAVEKWLREKFEDNGMVDLIEYIHFGLTSWDVNNIAYSLQLQRATKKVIIPVIKNLLSELILRADEYKDISMLARTHGQPAVPTTLGKEIVIFADRLSKELYKLENTPLTAKFNGAVGNFNALVIAYPDTDWIDFSKEFVETFGLEYNLATNQINSYDSIVEYLQTIQRINNILLNLDQDMWRYISDAWFVQKVKPGEVGSSTMPQKVNPIDFENSEGNLGLANSIIHFFSQKLPVSRLQRDLSDSTVVRNIGLIAGYSLLGYKSVLSGLMRISPNINKMEVDLHTDWAILAEAAQTILRKNGVSDAYNLILGITHGKHLGESEWVRLVNNLKIDKNDKQKLLNLTPSNYVGLSAKIVSETVTRIRKQIR